jgi:hypothetical protein
MLWTCERDGRFTCYTAAPWAEVITASGDMDLMQPTRQPATTYRTHSPSVTTSTMAASATLQ